LPKITEVLILAWMKTLYASIFSFKMGVG